MKRFIGIGAAVAIAVAAGWSAVSVAASGNPGTSEQRGEQREAAIRSSVQVPSEESQIAGLARVTIEQAIETAREASPGVVIAAELENEDGSLVWTVEIVSGAEVREVTIDAGNRRVLANEQEDDDGGEEEDEE